MLKILVIFSAIFGLSLAQTTPCHDEVQQKLLEQMKGPVFGLHFPTCTDDGWYTPKQCVEASCRCVTKDGQLIGDYQCPSWEATKMDCKCARDKAELEINVMPGMYARQCNEIGNYAPRQCHGSVCKCVDRNGKPIDGYEAHIGQAVLMSCECARRNMDIIQLGMNCIPHKCDNLGNFITPPTTAC